MQKAFPAEFRADVIAVARKGEVPLRQIAKDFGVSEACLHRWLRIADRDDGVDRTGSPVARDESAELREARKRIKLLEQEAEVMGVGADQNCGGDRSDPWHLLKAGSEAFSEFGELGVIVS